MSNRVFFTYEEDPQERETNIKKFRTDLKELYKKNPLVIDFSSLLPESREDLIVQANFPEDLDSFASKLQETLEEDPFPALMIVLPDDLDDEKIKALLDRLNVLSPGEGPNVFVFSNRDHK